jgi:hypothetical protein
MKTLITIILILALAVSCNNEEPGPQMGCQTGILKGGSTARVTIRCCTKEQHQAGDNTKIGGTNLFTYYSQVKWEAIDKCENCK